MNKTGISDANASGCWQFWSKNGKLSTNSLAHRKSKMSLLTSRKPSSPSINLKCPKPVAFDLDLMYQQILNYLRRQSENLYFHWRCLCRNTGKTKSWWIRHSLSWRHYHQRSMPRFQWVKHSFRPPAIYDISQANNKTKTVYMPLIDNTHSRCSGTRSHIK